MDHRRFVLAKNDAPCERGQGRVSDGPQPILGGCPALWRDETAEQGGSGGEGLPVRSAQVESPMGAAAPHW